MLDFFRRSLVSTIYESYRRSADRLHSTRVRNPLQELRDVIDVIRHCISLCLVTRTPTRGESNVPNLGDLVFHGDRREPAESASGRACFRALESS